MAAFWAAVAEHRERREAARVALGGSPVGHERVGSPVITPMVVKVAAGDVRWQELVAQVHREAAVRPVERLDRPVRVRKMPGSFWWRWEVVRGDRPVATGVGCDSGDAADRGRRMLAELDRGAEAAARVVEACA